MSLVSVFIDQFNDSSLDTSRFTASVAASGSIVESASFVTLSSPATSDAMLLTYNNEIQSGERRQIETYKLDFSVHSPISSAFRYFMLYEAASAPTQGTYNDANLRIWFDFAKAAAGANKFYVFYYNSTAKLISAANSTNANLLSYDTYYRVVFDHTAANWRMRIMSVNELTTYLDTGTIAWANTLAKTNKYWLILGADPYTGANWSGACYLNRFEAQTPNVWNHWTNKMIIHAYDAANKWSFSEPTAMFDDGKIRLWCTRLDQDTPINGGIYLTESSDLGITWTQPALCIDEHIQSYVYKHNDGYYYCMTSSFPNGTAASPTTFDVYRSASGSLGTWALHQANVISIGAAGQWDDLYVGNCWFYWDGSNWVVFYEGSSASSIWKVGRAIGTDWASLTKYGSNPTLDLGTTSVSCGEFHLISNKWYVWLHQSPAAGNIPSQIALYNTLSSDLTQQLSANRWDIPAYSPYNTDFSQIADPSVIEISGKSYIFYEVTINQTSPIQFNLVMATYDGTLKKVLGLPTVSPLPSFNG